jgi:hypothetical protein
VAGMTVGAGWRGRGDGHVGAEGRMAVVRREVVALAPTVDSTTVSNPCEQESEDTICGGGAP